MISRLFARSTQLASSTAVRPNTLFRHLPRFTFCSSDDLKSLIAKIVNEHGFKSNPNAIWIGSYQNLIKELVQARKFDDVIVLYKQLIKFLEKNKGESKVIRNVNKKLANVYRQVGMLKEKIATLEKVAQLEKVLGQEETFDHIKTLFQLGTDYNILGNNSEAKKFFLKTIDLHKKIGETDLRLVAVMVDLAKIYLKEGNFEESLKLFREAYTIMKEHRSKCTATPDKKRFTMIQLEIASIENDHGNRNSAIQIMEDARDFLKDLKDDIDVMYQAIDIYLKMGQIKQAEGLASQALCSVPRQVRPRILCHMANIHGQKKDYINGEATCRTILKLEKEESTLTLTTILYIKRALASYLLAQRKTEEYEKVLKEVVEEYSQPAGNQFFKNGLDCMHELAEFYFKQKRFEECEREHKKILQILEQPEVKTKEENYKGRGKSLESLIVINVLNLKFPEAIRFSLLAQEQFKKQKYANELNRLIKLNHAIGMSYLFMGQLQEARQHMLRYQHDVQKHSNKNDIIYAEYLERLAGIKQINRDLEGALENFKQSAKLYAVLAKQEQAQIMNEAADDIQSRLKAR